MKSNHGYDSFCNVIKYDYLASFTNVIKYNLLSRQLSPQVRSSQNHRPHSAIVPSILSRRIDWIWYQWRLRYDVVTRII